MSGSEKQVQARLLKMEVGQRTRAEASISHHDDGVAVGTVVDGGGFGSIVLVILKDDQVITAPLSPAHFNGLCDALVAAYRGIVGRSDGTPPAVTIQ